MGRALLLGGLAWGEPSDTRRMAETAAGLLNGLPRNPLRASPQEAIAVLNRCQRIFDGVGVSKLMLQA
jgi:hypothetical protein